MKISFGKKYFFTKGNFHFFKILKGNFDIFRNIFSIFKNIFFRSKKKVEIFSESLYRCKIFRRIHFSHPWSDLTSLKCSFGHPRFNINFQTLPKKNYPRWRKKFTSPPGQKKLLEKSKEHINIWNISKSGLPTPSERWDTSILRFCVFCKKKHLVIPHNPLPANLSDLPLYM